MNISIRPYTPADKVSVRLICCDTADKGRPIENIFPDRELAGDLLTDYYLTYESDACFVACEAGKVIGYILASFDNRRYGLVMIFILIPMAIAKAFMHGIFFNQQCWVFLKGLAGNWPRLFAWRKESFHSHQGHMHIGVALGYQGLGAGTGLVNALTVYAKTKGIHEIAASVHDGNQGACRFFERLGFTVRRRYPMVMARGDLRETYQSLLYVKTVV